MQKNMFPFTAIQSDPEFEQWMLWSREPDLQDFFARFLSDANGEKTSGVLPEDVTEWISKEIQRQDPAARGWGYRLDNSIPSIPGLFHCHIFVHRPGFDEEKARIGAILHPDAWEKVQTERKRMKGAVHAIDAVRFMKSFAEAGADETPHSIEDLADFVVLRRNDFLNISASEAQQILEECTTEGTRHASRSMICALPASADLIVDAVTSACIPNKMYIEDCWGQCLG